MKKIIAAFGLLLLSACASRFAGTAVDVDGKGYRVEMDGNASVRSDSS